MGLVKQTYVDGETVITADNLNDIQDAIIQSETDIGDVQAIIGDGQLVGFTATDLTSAANELNDEVIISDTQPTAANNKLWVKESSSSDGISIPTMEDIDDIEDDIGTIQNTLNQLETTTAQLDQNMAYVESGNTASRPYTGGEFISWKGTLYTASGSIPYGASFTTGTGGNLSLIAGSGGGLNNLIDSGNGYCKMPDGTMIQWGTVTAEVTYTAWGSWYESSIISLGNFPKAFVGNVPVVTVSLNNSSSAAVVNGANPTLTSLGNVRTYRPNATTNYVTVAWIAIGRWK